MSSFGALWKRAPLWRICCLLSLLGFMLTAFFPTASLKQLLPWLPGKAPYPVAPSTPNLAPEKVSHTAQETHGDLS